MTKHIDLLPCPFCGNTQDDFEGSPFGRPGHYVVRCGNPNCNAEVVGKTPEEAIKKWNRRTNATARHTPEALRAMARRIAEVAIGEMNPLSWLWEAYSMLSDIADDVEATNYSEIPEGWRLVPIDPTDEMVAAFWGDIQHGDVELAHAWDAYKDMLAAAPLPMRPRPHKPLQLAMPPCTTPSTTGKSEPEGWKWVPIKPTQKMLDAPQHTWQPEALHVWNAMLGAAPSQPRRPAHPRVEVTDNAIMLLRRSLLDAGYDSIEWDDAKAALKAALSEKGHE